MNGAQLIQRERYRQVLEEGYGAEHDARYTGGELRQAAICYALGHTQFWPDDWDMAFWKPTRDPVRDLVKAGALIAAEIDRLCREQGHIVAGIPAPGDEDRTTENVRVSVNDMERVAERRRELERTIKAVQKRKTETDERLSSVKRELREAVGTAAKALAERDDERERFHELRLHSSRLVELLRDAWWVEAAQCLDRLRELTA